MIAHHESVYRGTARLKCWATERLFFIFMFLITYNNAHPSKVHPARPAPHCTQSTVTFPYGFIYCNCRFITVTEYSTATGTVLYTDCTVHSTSV